MLRILTYTHLRSCYEYRAAVLSSCQRSLDRIGCAYVDLLQLHDPEFLPILDLLVEVTVPAMEEARKRG